MKREYYELEAVKNAWTGRELERQISSGLYERLLLSNDKELVMSMARNERLPETGDFPHGTNGERIQSPSDQYLQVKRIR